MLFIKIRQIGGKTSEKKQVVGFMKQLFNLSRESFSSPKTLFALISGAGWWVSPLIPPGFSCNACPFHISLFGHVTMSFHLLFLWVIVQNHGRLEENESLISDLSFGRWAMVGLPEWHKGQISFSPHGRYRPNYRLLNYSNSFKTVQRLFPQYWKDNNYLTDWLLIIGV